MTIAFKVGTEGSACSDIGKKLLGVIEHSLQAGGVVDLIHITGLDEFAYTTDGLPIVCCALGKTPQLMRAGFTGHRRLSNLCAAKQSEADERKLALGWRMSGQAGIEPTGGLVGDEANRGELFGLYPRFYLTQHRHHLARLSGMQHCYRLLKR